MDGRHCIGRFIPGFLLQNRVYLNNILGLQDRTPQEQAAQEERRDYVRDSGDPQTEVCPILYFYSNDVSQNLIMQVNIQLGTFTLKTSRLEALDPRVSDMSDFNEACLLEKFFLHSSQRTLTAVLEGFWS